MTVPTVTHPSPETLAQFNRGALPPSDRFAVEAHVAGCNSCCAALAALSEDRLVSLARQAAADVSPTTWDVPPELVDHPRYRVLGPLGAGGMGVVYRAEHRLMDRVVALKVVSRRYTASPAAAERFRREVRAAARLDHANIVRAHDAEEANGLHFLVMECVEGISLDRLVARRGPLPVATACQCVRQAALGLQHAHERGMVHRDIKPHNLMVTRKGQLKVLDFGLARVAAEADLSIRPEGLPAPDGAVTTPSLVLGTPDYLAPEQARNAHDVDIRADIYSLGCVLYYLLTGKPPFAGRGAGIEKMLAHVQDQPHPVRSLRPEVPPALGAVLDRMMAKDPARRFATPAAVAAAIKPFTKSEAAADDQPEIVEPPPLPASAAPTMTMNRIDTDVAPRRPTVHRKRPPKRSVRRAPLIVAGSIVVVAAVAIALFVAYGGTGAGDSKSKEKVELASAPVPRRVLIVVPKRNVYFRDFEPVKKHLKQEGFEVVTASSEVGDCWVTGQPPGGARIQAEVRVADVKPADFAGVLFTGKDTAEFTEDPTSETFKGVETILKEMESSGRVVGAICHGQQVLLQFGVLRGRMAAGCWGIGKPAYYDAQSDPLAPGRVHTDRRVVTAAGSYDAEAFAQEVLNELRK